MKIDLNMSDPLTLGLTLGIGHPVTERIRRITMRQTNKYMLGGTVIIIAAGLGLSSTALTSETSEPIKEAVKTVLEKVEAPALTEVNSVPTLMPEAPKRFAEAPSTQPTVQSAAVTRLTPMQLRMKPEFTPAQIAKIETQRQAYTSGDESSIDDLNKSMANINHNNRFQVTISENGDGLVEVSKGRGGWPGFPKSNTDWGTRTLSVDMQRGLDAVMKRCAVSDRPIHFMATLNDGDGDIGKGDFEVGCVPGTQSQRAQLTYVDYAQAYLESNDLPQERRQNLANLTANFGMLSEYVLTTPNATITQDRIECVKIHEKTKKEYGFTQSLRESSDRFLAKCSTTNYNWVRRRENMPEVQ